jgi:DNA-binding ferritin-like protein (Dps family)
MAQSLEVNIKTTSDVPQATEKAKAAVNGFDKQISDISKKFSTSFKDIFLSFLGPMALVTTAIAFIGKLITDNQKKHEDAYQAAINDTNDLMSAEDRYYAKKFENEKKDKEKKEEATVSREDITRHFLANDPRGQALVPAPMAEPAGTPTVATWDRARIIDMMAKDKSFQDKVQAMIAEDMKKNPLPIAEAKAVTSFKSPEGFGNIVGVGANPVIEAMGLQLEEAKKQTQLLEEIRNGNGGGVPTDFTKPQPINAASRSGSI